MELMIEENYLSLPICMGQPEKLLEIFIEGSKGVKKWTELRVPISENQACDYFAYIPVKAFQGKKIVLKGEFPKSFWQAVSQTACPIELNTKRPTIHFTAQTGWINDPNGLVYANGIYHLYFQYNPFNTSWHNMSWGHATSCDLLHWEQQDTVLFPDEHGMIFSGSGLVNDRALFNLPKDALIFFYTAAGKNFTQRLAYSLDGGKTLIKASKACVKTLAKENRDPKVFWHEASGAYIMSLWLEKNQFALLRSKDLKAWEVTDSFSLEGAWECPDLMALKTEDGQLQWVFWSADGFYYWGEFDGYTFKTDGVQHHAYMNALAYAAQTYSGTSDRVISVPWLRTQNHGEVFTGAMGLPRELSVKLVEGERVLVQAPTRELMAQRQLIWEQNQETLFKYETKAQKALQLVFHQTSGKSQWLINQTRLSYDSSTGQFNVEEASYFIGKDQEDFCFLIDGSILEVMIQDYTVNGMFELTDNCVNISIELERIQDLKVYEIL